MLQYFAQDFFAPITIFGHIDIKMILRIYVASDLLTAIKDADAFIDLYRWNSFEPIEKVSVHLDMVRSFHCSTMHSLCYNYIFFIALYSLTDFLQDPGQSKEVFSAALELFLINQNCTLTNCFISLSLKVNNISIAPDNFVLPTSLKNANLTAPILKVSKSCFKFKRQQGR